MPQVDFYVTPVDAHPILGLADCLQLGLIKHVCSIQDESLSDCVCWAWHTWHIPHNLM